MTDIEKQIALQAIYRSWLALQPDCDKQLLSSTAPKNRVQEKQSKRLLKRFVNEVNFANRMNEQRERKHGR